MPCGGAWTTGSSRSIVVVSCSGVLSVHQQEEPQSARRGRGGGGGGGHRADTRARARMRAAAGAASWTAMTGSRRADCRWRRQEDLSAPGDDRGGCGGLACEGGDVLEEFVDAEEYVTFLSLSLSLFLSSPATFLPYLSTRALSFQLVFTWTYGRCRVGRC